MASADRIIGAVRGLLNGYSAERPGGGVQAVHVDEIGLGGGVLDRLAETLPRVEWVTYTTGYQPRIVAHRPKAEGFAASKGAANADRFRNRRAEAFWTLRKLLEDGRLAFPHVPELREELLATRVRFGADGRTEIEGKEAIAGRLGRSPDYADALVISLAPLIENPNPRPKVRWC